jgi:FkbM family methyltransferase
MLLRLPTEMVMECWPGSYSASQAVSFSGWPDFNEMSFLWRYLRPGDAFLDVGANIGLYTLLAAACVGASGTIAAFEAAPESLERLRRNLSLNSLKQVQVYPMAVAHEPGELSFSVGQDAMNRVRPDAGSLETTARVQAVRLDDVLPSHLGFAAGKIDIEGFEPLAMRGAIAHLGAANPPVWVLELCNHVRNFGHTEEGFAGWLRAQGFDLGLYDARESRLRFPERPWTERPNVLLIARSHRLEVERRLHDGTRPLPIEDSPVR